MKITNYKLRITFLILLFISNLPFAISQDREAQPMNFVWGSSSNPRPFSLDSFPQNNFLTGFQWSGNKKMNHALLNNSGASGEDYWENGTNYTSRRYAFNQPTYILYDTTVSNRNTGYFVGIANAPAMVYEPTLLIPYGQEGQYITRQYDSTNAIFGFRNIQGEIKNSSQHNDENYNRLILHKNLMNGVNPDTGLLVLNDIWPKPQFLTYPGVGQSTGYRGEKWNLTINLRRYGIAADDTLDNNVVLEIKLPYRATKYDTIHYYEAIGFDSLPSNNLIDTFRISYREKFDFRGYELRRTGQRDSILRIYRSMLPVDTNHKDITISAHFLTYSNGLNHNPPDNPAFLGSFDTQHNPQIDSLDIEVRYIGITDVCIDYIKLENDEAYYLSRGAMDSLGITWFDPNGSPPQHDAGPKAFRIYNAANQHPITHNDSIVMTHTDFMSIKDVLQSRISNFPKYTLNGVANTNAMFRFYGQEWESSNPVVWWQLRYFNLLTNGMATTSDAPYLTRQWEYYTRCPAKYMGIKLDVNEHQMSNPTFRINSISNDFRALGLKWGYMGFYYPAYDTLHSHYETQFNWNPWAYDSATSPYNDYSQYKYYRDASFDGFQPRWENRLTSTFFENNYPKAHYFLFSDKPWWMNLWIGSNWGLDSVPGYGTTNNKNAFCIYDRPKTGEEINLLLKNSVILGCKGLYYDRDGNQKVTEQWLGIGQGDAIDSASGIYFNSDRVGADFMSQINDSNNFSSYVNFDTVSKYIGIRKDRFYIGKKSVRMEIAKIHKLIRANDSTLMRLRLAAWYAKGFRAWYNQDSLRFGNDTIMKKFISLDPNYIKVRPIGRTKLVWGGDEYYYMNYYEPWDSVFLDITILRDSSDHNLTGDHWTLGIQNRRTDPLIYSIDSVSGEGMDSSMKFYSTVEISII